MTDVSSMGCFVTSSPEWVMTPALAEMYFPREPLNGSDRLLNATLRPDLLVATLLSPEDPSGHASAIFASTRCTKAGSR
jgi:hypothetical protein